MKKLMVFALALLLPFTTEAQERTDSVTVAEFGLYYQNLIRKDEKDVHRFFAEGYEYMPKKSYGWWGFAYREEGYLSATWGLFYDPMSWLSLGLAVGGETFTNEAGAENSVFGRWAVTAFAGTKKTFVEGYFESGPSKSSWHRVDFQLWANRYIAVGGISQTGDGFGPKLRLSAPISKRWDFRLWGAPMLKYKGAEYYNCMPTCGEMRSSSPQILMNYLLLGGEFVWTLREASK